MRIVEERQNGWAGRKIFIVLNVGEDGWITWSMARTTNKQLRALAGEEEGP